MTAAAFSRIDGAPVWVQPLPDLGVHWAWVHGTTEFVTWPSEGSTTAWRGMTAETRSLAMAVLLHNLVARAKASR